MRHISIGFCLCVFVTLTSTSVQAQSLPSLVEQLGIKELARDYLRPAVDAVGYTINSALSHTAKIDSGLTLRLGGSFINTYIPEEQREFMAKLPAELTQLGFPGTITTATIAGGKGAVLRSSDPNVPQEIVLPDGADFSNVFFVMPQLSIGSVLGTELLFRGLPPVTYTTELGKVSFYGIGIKHAPTYFAELPFDLAFIAAYHQFQLGDMVDGTSMAGMAQISVDAEAVTIYGGLGYEAYQINVGYEYVSTDPLVPSGRIDLDFRRRNLRFSLGAAMTLFDFVLVAADYSFGEQDNLSLTAALQF
ncbi:MAG: hypothetical protein M5R41_19660 [Bacteroidia bacterium]|nr:hypothetical protein [Bacteroidia bacterium]